VYRTPASGEELEDWRVAFCREHAVARWVRWLRTGDKSSLRDGDGWWRSAEEHRQRLIDPHP
jgi:hypothetical protein